MWDLPLRRIVTLLISVVLLIGSLFSSSNAYAQTDIPSNTIRHEDTKPISRHAFERLENAGTEQSTSSIGNTQLKSGQEFRKKLPETLDSDLRQLRPNHTPGEPNQGVAIEKAQQRVERAEKRMGWNSSSTDQISGVE